MTVCNDSYSSEVIHWILRNVKRPRKLLETAQNAIGCFSKRPVIRPDIPIILCTGFSEQIDERRAEEMGISAFVMKPVVMRQIANTIREVLGDQK